jgi:anhydro-N-acetylmuramic acid kinase
MAPPELGDADRMATLVAVQNRCIAAELAALPRGWRRSETLRVLVTGGGRHNVASMRGLRAELPGTEVEAIEAIGENGDAKEAVDFAWLAVQTAAGRSVGIGELTGAVRDAVAGSLYPFEAVAE